MEENLYYAEIALLKSELPLTEAEQEKLLFKQKLGKSKKTCIVMMKSYPTNGN